MRARNAVVAAHDDAQAAGHSEILPAHLVLGLLTEPDALAAHALRATGAHVPRCAPPRALALVPIAAGVGAGSPAAAAEGTTCISYSETTGSCITQWYGEDGTLHTILSFYWGSSWIDLPLA